MSNLQSSNTTLINPIISTPLNTSTTPVNASTVPIDVSSTTPVNASTIPIDVSSTIPIDVSSPQNDIPIRINYYPQPEDFERCEFDINEIKRKFIPIQNVFVNSRSPDDLTNALLSDTVYNSILDIINSLNKYSYDTIKCISDNDPSQRINVCEKVRSLDAMANEIFTRYKIIELFDKYEPAFRELLKKINKTIDESYKSCNITNTESLNKLRMLQSRIATLFISNDMIYAKMLDFLNGKSTDPDSGRFINLCKQTCPNDEQTLNNIKKYLDGNPNDPNGIKYINLCKQTCPNKEQIFDNIKNYLSGDSRDPESAKYINLCKQVCPNNDQILDSVKTKLQNYIQNNNEPDGEKIYNMCRQTLPTGKEFLSQLQIYLKEGPTNPQTTTIINTCKQVCPDNSKKIIIDSVTFYVVLSIFIVVIFILCAHSVYYSFISNCS